MVEPSHGPFSRHVPLCRVTAVPSHYGIRYAGGHDDQRQWAVESGQNLAVLPMLVALLGSLRSLPPDGRDGVYGVAFSNRIAGLGIEEVKTAAQSPWRNPFVERLVGSLRRDCLDHVIVLGEAHLRYGAGELIPVCAAHHDPHSTRLHRLSPRQN